MPKRRLSNLTSCRRSACGRRGLCPCASISRSGGGLVSTDRSVAPPARTSPSVRSADTAEPFPGGQPVKPLQHGCHPAPLPMGLSGPVRFLFSACSGFWRMGATPCWLSPRRWLSARPSMPNRTTLSPLDPHHSARLLLPPGCQSGRGSRDFLSYAVTTSFSPRCHPAMHFFIPWRVPRVSAARRS